MLLLLCFILNHHEFFFPHKFQICSFVIFPKQLFAAYKEIHNLTIFDHTQRSTTTERRITIGGQIIAVMEIVPQIEIDWLQLIFGNALLQPISVRNCTGPERVVFCILIFDIIPRSALVGFSLLRATN